MTVILVLWVSPLLASSAITADPATGRIAVETPRCSAQFEAGVLTYLYNKLTRRALIGGKKSPTTAPTQTALAVQATPLSEPVYWTPVPTGDNRSAVTVDKMSPSKLAVTFTGLKGPDGAFHSDEKLILTVRIDGPSGEILVSMDASSNSTAVVGTTFGFSGLMRRYINYSPNAGGSWAVGDTQSRGYSPISGTLEWANFSMGRRTGPHGSVWSVPLTVIASAEDRKSAFAIWCEDDKLFPKYYIGQSDSVSYASFEYPPYDENRHTKSVTWHINTYSGGWTEAAKPYADSLVRRGFTKRRAPWAKDISVIIQVPDLASMWVDPLAKIFPSEDRKHVMIYANGWRNAGFDNNHWDYTPTSGFIQGARHARELGFHTLVYMQPMYCWGDASVIEDVKYRDEVWKMEANSCLDPFGKHEVKFTGLNLAYSPWRKLLLDAARNAIMNYDVQGVYLDSTFIVLPDGRGRIEGMTSCEGMYALINGLREMNPNIFLGTEWPNELMAWGTDFGLHTGLEWAGEYKEAKAHSSHPILNYAFQHVMVSMAHNNYPSVRTVREFHLMEEIAERTGQVAAVSYDSVENLMNLDTPEKQLWIDKAKLFAHRGLRPYYPVKWEEGVMSYLKAADGTVFVYRETPFGSVLIERAKGRHIYHWGRIWKVGQLKTSSMGIPNWPARANDGAWLGLDIHDSAYVLRTGAPVERRIRILSLPSNVCLKDWKVTDYYGVFTFKKRSGGKAEAEQGNAKIGVLLPQPLVRVTADSDLPVSSLGNGRYEVSVPLDKPVGIVWAANVALPFEYRGDFETPWTETPAMTPQDNGKPRLYQIGSWDLKWTADMIGVLSPRPGTIYSLSCTVTPSGGREAASFACFTSPATQGDTFFRQSNGRDGSRIAQIGMRTTAMDLAWLQPGPLVYRLYADGPVNVDHFSPVRWVRPELDVSDLSLFDLGSMQPGAASMPSKERFIINSQLGTVSDGKETMASVLYGTAVFDIPTDKPYLQQCKGVGAIIIGKDAARFAFVSDHPGETAQQLKLVGQDGLDGINGGLSPERESLTIKFLGSDAPGTYTAIVRVVTQAGNMGVRSTGQPGEPLPGFYYLDIPVIVKVETN